MLLPMMLPNHPILLWRKSAKLTPIKILLLLMKNHTTPEKKDILRDNFFREITFLVAVLNSSKIDFWPFLKLQEMDFGQKKISRGIDLCTIQQLQKKTF